MCGGEGRSIREEKHPALEACKLKGADTETTESGFLQRKVARIGRRAGWKKITGEAWELWSSGWGRGGGGVSGTGSGLGEAALGELLADLVSQFPGSLTVHTPV